MDPAKIVKIGLNLESTHMIVLWKHAETIKLIQHPTGLVSFAEQSGYLDNVVFAFDTDKPDGTKYREDSMIQHAVLKN